MVESGLSSVKKILSKDRKKINICKRGDIVIKLTSIKPRIKELAVNHQVQGSHGINKKYLPFLSIIIDFIKIIVHFIIGA
ncbi:hypothetical protein A3Q56_04323 [Intoshia linei]|uniref:Uncharacterized protein n=1 Tax=Intoshia linei TaxID=1819745 RepID=A0A177B0Y6_9BILA|nr:hypothetical protein A3Q56_04323 [Intoshia linei]